MGARWALAALGVLLMAFTGIASADPPVRVMRLSNLSGAVSFSTAGSDDWVFAPLNRPVVYGDRLWTDADGRAEIELGNGTAWLGPHTSLRVLNLDDDVVQLEVTQGTVILRVRKLDANDTVEIDTPNLAFVVTRAGRYRIAVDDGGDATLVAVRDGAADVYGGRSSYVVTRNQTYRFYGTDLTDSEFVDAPPIDALERYASDRARRFDRVVSARYVSTEVIGYADLDTYGSWSTVPEYGNVWFPREVAQDWAPYRYGHWSWIDPWGWTWVDDAPWGFAPFHYGRWLHVSRGWCWVPGPSNVRPVYAPALVAFVGGGNVSLTVSSGPAIGWFPLAPREVYRPWYAASPSYVRQVNVTNTRITNVTVINNIISNPAAVTQVNQYVNLRAPNAITAVPPAAMAQAQPVQRAVVQVRPQTLDRSHVTQIVQIAPEQRALIGATRPAQAKPPARLETRAVVAKTPPPPAPIPVAQKLPALQKDPKPIERPQTSAGAPAAAPAAPGAAPQAGTPARPGAPAATTAARGEPPANVRVVQAAKPAANAAPPAKAPDASRATAPKPEERAAPSTAQPAAPAAAPPQGTPPTAQPPAGQPPAGQPPAPQPARPGTAQPPRDESRAPPPSREAPKAPAPPAEPPRAPAASPAAQEPKGPAAPRAAEPPKAPTPPGQGPREESKAPSAPGQGEDLRRVTPPGQRNGGPAATPPGRPPEAPAPAVRSAPAQPQPAPEAARREAPRPAEAAPGNAPMERRAQEPPRQAPTPAPAPQAAPPRPPETPRAGPPPQPEAPRAAPPRPAEAPRAAPPPQPAPSRAPEAARPAPTETRQAPTPPPRAAPAPEPKAAPAPGPGPQQQRAPEQRGGGPADKGKEREKDKDKKDGQG